MNYKIRIASIYDLDSIVEIYNQAVKARFETADTQEVNFSERISWFQSHHPEKYPILLFTVDDKVVAWLSISPYREGRTALRYTAEVSYYVHKEFKRKGIASELMKLALQKSKELNLKTFFAIVLDENKASISLLEKFGFTKWGHLPNVADFDGVECGHVYYGLRINNL